MRAVNLVLHICGQLLLLGDLCRQSVLAFLQPLLFHDQTVMLFSLPLGFIHHLTKLLLDLLQALPMYPPPFLLVQGSAFLCQSRTIFQGGSEDRAFHVRPL